LHTSYGKIICIKEWLMNMKFLLPLAAAASLGLAASANALVITEEPGSNLAAFSYSVNTATRTIDIYETWGVGTSPNVLLRFTDFDSSRSSWVINKYVTNETGVEWTAFSHELLRTDKSGSPDDDGLSFAQFGVPTRPRTSDSFATVTADELSTRDYLNFTDGTVANGATVFFSYGLTDRRGESDPFFLRQLAAEIAVPEPATWAMLITGFGLVGFSLRRRRVALGNVSA
jgi:hypothetical protein